MTRRITTRQLNVLAACERASAEKARQDRIKAETADQVARMDWERS